MITLIGTPNDFNPVYNPVHYYFDSTNKNVDGFKYVVNVYPYGSTASKLYSAKPFPRYGDGYLDVDLQAILATNLSYTIPFQNGVGYATSSFIEYDIVIGEEYLVNWAYDDYEFYANTASNFNAYCKLASTASNTFAVGDQINIVQNDGGLTKPILNGLHTVVELSGNDVVIELTFGDVGSGPTIGGTVSYANNRKTTFLSGLTVSRQVGWNGSFDAYDFTDYNQTTYKLNQVTGDKLLLTDLELRKTGAKYNLRTTSKIWLNSGNFYSSTASFVYFANDGGNIFKKSISGTVDPIIQFGAGPGNLGTLTLVSGTGSLVESTTKYYDIWVGSTVSTSYITEKYRIGIDRNCTINDYDINFVDSKGSWQTIPAYLKAYSRENTTDMTYTKIWGDYNAAQGKFNYNKWDRGKTTYGGIKTKFLKVNTNYLTEPEARLIGLLKSSPSVFLSISGVEYSVNVLNKDFEFKTYKNNKSDIQYDIDLEFSIPTKINI